MDQRITDIGLCLMVLVCRFKELTAMCRLGVTGRECVKGCRTARLRDGLLSWRGRALASLYKD